jgi:hypothetical protein
MSTWKAVAGTAFVAAAIVAGATRAGSTPLPTPAQGGSTLSPAYLDQLLAPVALYPDPLLAQMLLCAGNASKVSELGAWLKRNASLKGTELQQAAQNAGFEPSFVALAPFPQVVDLLAGNPTWTSQLGGAFAVDRGAVFDSIQRLRAQSQAAGNLKSTPQQTVETRTTQGGQQVIVIEPANPQVVYVPQYDPQVVYTQPASTTVVVKEDSDDDEAVAAGVIGFAAGIAIGAAIDNNYYYGPYGWRGGAYMYNDAWDDWHDDRQDAREDWYDNREDAREDFYDNRDDAREHREDVAGERSERAQTSQQERSERQQARGAGSTEAQAQREQRRAEGQGAGQQARSTTTTPQARSSATTQQARSTTTSARGQGGGVSSYESRGYSGDRSGGTAERSGTRSDAFSGYSSGRSTRSESSRGQRSRSGGGRSRRR